MNQFTQQCFAKRKIVATGHLTSDMKDRLIRNLASGYMLSYFDGMSGSAHIKSQILAEVNSHLGTPISFPTYAGCDMQSSRRTIMENFDDEHKCQHIRRNLLERLPEEVQDEIKELTPKTDEWVEASRLANVNIAKVLSKTYRERRDEVNSSFCTLHNQNCPVEPTDEAIRISSFAQSEFPGLSGDGGKHMSGHYCLSEELLRRKNVKAAIAECTKLWGATSMARKLQQKFKAKQTLLTPRQIGDSYDRERRVVVFLDHEEFFVLH